MKKAEKIIEMNEYKKGTNNKKESIKMTQISKTAKVVGKVFMAGFKTQLAEESTLATGVTIGVMQGLKYNGNVKRGVKAGLATVGVFATANGVKSVMSNIDYIKGNI